MTTDRSAANACQEAFLIGIVISCNDLWGRQRTSV
jgi:hypothetical protein